MKKTRILHLGLTSNYGGVESYCFNLSNHINRDKFQLDFVSIKGIKLAHEDAFIRSGSMVYRLTSKRENILTYFVEIIRLFRHGDYDIIEFHLMSYRWFDSILIAQLLSKAKVVLHAHTTRMTGMNRLDSTIARCGEVLVSIGASQRVACGLQAGTTFFRGRSYQIMKNAIDVDRYIYDDMRRDIMRSELGLDKAFVIGHVGMFWPPKNHEFIIDIFAAAYEKDNNLKLLLIGDGGGISSIRHKVDLMGLSHRVIFLGSRSDIGNILQAVDVLILPSLYEGLGLVLIEAQASGLKCLASARRVPEDAAITENISFVSIEDGVLPWVEKLTQISQLGYNRNNQKEAMVKAGYSIKDQIKVTEQFYLKQRKPS